MAANPMRVRASDGKNPGAEEAPTSSGAPGVAPYRLCLILVLAVGLWLRMSGLGWGLPNALHPDFSYHPDETYLLLWAQWLQEGRIVAKQFIYGGTLYCSVLNGYRYVATLLSGNLGGANFLADVLIVGRIATALFSVLAILFTAATARRLYGNVAGIAAAAILALCPAHAFLAQNLRPDELSTTLVALLLYLSVWRWQRIEPTPAAWPDFVIGLLIGAMLALRFPLALFVFAPLTVMWLRQGQGSLTALRALILGRPLWSMAAAIVLAYCLCSPHSLLYPEGLRAGLQVQWHYQSGVFEDAIGRGPGLYQYGVSMLAEAMGWPLYLLAVLSVIASAWRRRPGDLLLLSALLPYLLLTSSASWVVVRYTLPLLPVLAILIARGLAHVPGEPPRHRWWRTTVALALVLTLLPVLALRQALTAPNTREVAGRWIEAHARPGALVVSFETYGGDTFYRPTLTARVEAQAFPLHAGIDPSVLERIHPAPLLVLSEDVYANMDRLGSGHPKASVRRLAQTLRPEGPFRVVHRFEPELRFLGVDFSSWFRSQDYRVVRPGFRLYERIDTQSPLARDNRVRAHTERSFR